MGIPPNHIAFGSGLPAIITTKTSGFVLPVDFDPTPLDIEQAKPANQPAAPSKPRVLTRAERRAAYQADQERKKAERITHETFCTEHTKDILAAWAEAHFDDHIVSWETLMAEHTLATKNGEVSGNIYFIGQGLNAGGYRFTVMVMFDIKNGAVKELNLKGDTVMKVHIAIAGVEEKIKPLAFSLFFDRPDAGFWHPVQHYIEPPRPVVDPLDLEDDPNPIVEYFSDLLERWRSRNLRVEVDTSNIGSEETPDGVVTGLAYQVAKATEEPSLLAVMADSEPD